MAKQMPERNPAQPDWTGSGPLPARGGRSRTDAPASDRRTANERASRDLTPDTRREPRRSADRTPDRHNAASRRQDAPIPGERDRTDRPVPPRGGTRPPAQSTERQRPADAGRHGTNDGYGGTGAGPRWDTDRRLRSPYRENAGAQGSRPQAEPHSRRNPDTSDGNRRDWLGDNLDRPSPPATARRYRTHPDAPHDDLPGTGRDRRFATPRRSTHDGPFAAEYSTRSRRDHAPRHIDNDDRGYDDDSVVGDPDDTTSERVVTEGIGRGAGGRMLAIAGVLFLGLTVVFAGAGGLFDNDNDRAPANIERDDREISAGSTNSEQLPGDAFETNAETGQLADTGAVDGVEAAAPAPAPEEDDEPVVRQMGYPGPWLDDVPTICIDPGHGGESDRGRIRYEDGVLPELHEADYTLIQGLELREQLEAEGVVVVMTRTTDAEVNISDEDINGDGLTIADSERDGKFDEFQARIDICNRANADLMISLHINGFDVERPNGYEAWYTGAREFSEQSRRFAALAVTNLGVEMSAAGYNGIERGVKDDASVSVDDSDPLLEQHMILTGPAIAGKIEPSAMPSAIVECLFITNQSDAIFLVSEAGSDAIVTAYAQAITQYFDEYQF